MIRSLGSAVALVSFVAGCSTMEKLREEPDTTPANATAVMETHLVSDGLKGFFPFEGTTKTYTRADMHRGDSNIKGTGTVTRFLIGTNASSRIERLDKKLVYTLDAKEKTYTECPLKGCGSGVAEKPAKKEAQEKKAERPRGSDCKVKIANATFTVKQTGQKKSINSFDTEQYQAAWIVTMQDPTARKTVSTLNVDLLDHARDAATQGGIGGGAGLREEPGKQPGQHCHQRAEDPGCARRSGEGHQHLYFAVTDARRPGGVSENWKGAREDQGLSDPDATGVEPERRCLRGCGIRQRFRQAIDAEEHRRPSIERDRFLREEEG
jgi:hypothetical protein